MTRIPVQEMTSSAWRRAGSSIVWSAELLGPLITGGPLVSLRTALGWVQHAFPDEPPGKKRTVLVGGLQTVLESFPAEAAEAACCWLRKHVSPLVRAFQAQWPDVGLVFGMDGPGTLFSLNDADDLLYFGRSKERAEQVKLTFGLWGGAATGEGVSQLVEWESKEVGGYHVQRIA